MTNKPVIYRGKGGKFTTSPYRSKIHQEWCESKGYKILQRKQVATIRHAEIPDGINATELIEIEVGEWRTWTLPHIADLIAESLDKRPGKIAEKMRGYDGEPYCKACGKEYGAD
tara:strand:- start:17677 stop:18018 length:342 start_codon:yes stop_codon:yes gene_type:complete